jgi:methionine synthase I (cobalamin-dependent)
LIVMVTVDEEGNCLDGTSAEEAARLLTEWGVDALGCNCSSGPAVVLTAIERMRTVTDAAAGGDAERGDAASVDGRNIYLTSPEYLASFREEVCKGRGDIYRGMLRDDAEPHPRAAVGVAGAGSAGGGGAGDVE